ncbi:MAG: hypothetical protein M5R40_09855 [Anaerolineae bacterium]|nr:hypothetical protein [Anaerolineae bacterium]
MTKSEERKRILQMIAEGKVSVDEGALLLQALQSGNADAKPGAEKRWLRVRITDLDSGDVKVSVNIPLSLAQVALKMGARFVPEVANVNVQEIMTRIRDGEAGRIVDAVDEEDGERFRSLCRVALSGPAPARSRRGRR